MRGQGAVLSAGIHLTLLMIAYMGLPELFQRKVEPQPLVITLEKLPITGKTNVKPSDKPVTKPRKEKPAPAKVEKKKLPPPSKPKAAPKKEAVPLPAKDKPKPKKEAEKKPPKKEEPKKEKVAETPDTDEFDDVLKNLRKDARDGEKSEKKPAKKPAPATNQTKSIAPYDPTIPLSLSERDAITSQFVQCWRIPAGSANDYELKVSVDVNLRQNGSVVSAQLAKTQHGRYKRDTVFRAAADSAVRAVHKCNPITGLPLNKYNSWKEMTLHFDPSMQLY